MATHVFETMGTVVSLAFRSAVPTEATLSAIETEFGDWDARYSLYRADSELSRLASGELSLLDASDQLRETYALAATWRAETAGAFTPNRPDGVIDLSGVVKALAIAEAASILEEADTTEWAINVGGDVLISASDQRPWIVGIVDPHQRGEFLTSIALADGRRACATSGSSERGDHIWRPAGRSNEFVQVTVIANDIVDADVLATAIVAGGAETLDLVCRSWPVDVISVGVDGSLRMTPGAVRSMNRAGQTAHT